MPLLAISLSGCIAKTLVDVATAPIRVANKAVDLATTGQSEADQKRGREIRRREERLGKLERDHAKYSERCAKGDDQACARRDAAYGEIQALLPTVPLEAERR
ncbi:MAG TPA: hypothetical protein VHG29_02935 [Novosphingobium sp.]|nr:hypothetical protein [Novosphingobium sp.]